MTLAGRAPARHLEAIRNELRRRGVRFSDEVYRATVEVGPWSVPSLRPYQDSTSAIGSPAVRSESSRHGSESPSRGHQTTSGSSSSTCCWAREALVARCAGELGVSPAGLMAALFADLPSERIAVAPPALDPGDLGLRANLALAQGLLARAYSVKIALEGNARAVARHAALCGLICSASRADGDDHARIELSGPFALFRRTLLYGRALGAVVPVLAWTRRFELEATRDDPGRWWFVEIVGFWTPEYLANKLALLKRARVANLVLCIDADRNVGDGDLGSSVAVVRYRRRVDAAKVLEVVASAKART